MNARRETQDESFKEATRPLLASRLIRDEAPLSSASSLEVQKLAWDLTILSGIVESEIQNRNGETDLASTEGAS